MYLKELNLWNFRKYKTMDENPGLKIEFNKGVNLIVGENDSGKSAIVDAIKILLQTQSSEYIKITDDDFYYSDDFESNVFKIECIFDELSDEEAKNFLEWIQAYKDTNSDGIETIKYKLRVFCICSKENNKIYNEFRAGFTDDGTTMDSKARELLKAVYLKPLRDAEYDLRATRNSRLSQILLGHTSFLSGEEHQLVQILNDANFKIEEYFETDDSDNGGKKVSDNIVKHLNEFCNPNSSKEIHFSTSGTKLKQILEGMSLSLSDIKPGLGSLNLLFIATELLLLDNCRNGGLKLVLIEEIESHLHPQAQLRLIEYIQKEYDNGGVQFILTTHSPNVTSKINLKNILICKDNKGFSLKPEKTKLTPSDYLFLQRFLDVTKSNMFFSQGLIFVEGISEFILLPTITQIIDIPLHTYGITIVNVENTAFLRYSKIFLRASEEDGNINIPISIITDCDVKPSLETGQIQENMEELEAEITRKYNYFSEKNINAFVSPRWTFEYCLGLSSLQKYFYKAILLAKKVQNSEKNPITEDKIVEVNTQVDADYKLWAERNYSNERISYLIYKEIMLKESDKVSKAIVSQCLSNLLLYEILDEPKSLVDIFDVNLFRKKVNDEMKAQLKSKILSDRFLAYLINGIRYAANVVENDD